MTGTDGLVGTFLGLLGRVPGPVWSGLVGSFVTVVGVLFPNAGLSTRHREQLAHAARESSLEREMELRRDTYMPAIEGVLGAMIAIGTLVDPTVKQSELASQYAQAMAALGKVTAIARPDTVIALGEWSVLFQRMFIKLLLIRERIDQVYVQLMGEGSVVDRVTQRHASWVETQTGMLFDGPVDQAKWDFVQGQIEFVQRQIAEWAAKRSETALRLRAMQLEFFRALHEGQPEIASAGNRAVVALRREFELAGDDLAAVREAMKRNSEEALRMLGETVKLMETSHQGSEGSGTGVEKAR